MKHEYKPESVSYTHLDVYKRQVLYNRLPGTSLPKCIAKQQISIPLHLRQPIAKKQQARKICQDQELLPNIKIVKDYANS